MKSIIIASLLLFGIFAFWACKTPKQDTKNTTPSVAKSDRPMIEGRWHLVRSKDNYNNIWAPRTESETYITIGSEGSYAEKDKWNPECTGSYRIIAKEKISISKECNKATLEYGIKELTEEKLVLSMQGRHGAVLQEYERIN